MNKTLLIELLENEYPAEAAMLGDYIGEQVTIPDEVNKVLVTLDVTIDTISQAVEQGVQLIISHHPLYFGEKEEVFANDIFAKSKYELLEKSNIGLFVIHTNADFNPSSIAFNQALVFDAKEVYQNNENKSVTLELEEELTIFEIVDIIKRDLELVNEEFRTNSLSNESYEKVVFASGTSGDVIGTMGHDVLYVIGEVKHHEWVKAEEQNYKVLEITHFSEKLFKDMIEIYLEEEDLEVIKSEETNGYKII